MGSRSFTSDRDCIIQNASCNKFVVEPPLERPDALREDGGGEVFVGGTRGRNRCRLSPRRRAWTRRRRARRLPFPRPSPRETSVRPPLSHPAARVQATWHCPSPCPGMLRRVRLPGAQAVLPTSHRATAQQPRGDAAGKMCFILPTTHTAVVCMLRVRSHSLGGADQAVASNL
jgi:hypothetical protein